ncbi:BFD (2Fe-2S)-binding domain-containing protein [Paraburkholderia hospita]|uniref:BFD (2Fe-2S)-binding domain-containing protein n=1 Tax=Paraburkholderia hospita TaxID=169430 RepID=A0ABN0FR62_9BURK|nr:BFD (2Fe-2S)-binding domain-containing protein [Paraburkholderia hospita]SEI15370.1 hypothetical protein SAMN05192544_102649 [Paraburkholderia hospita]
MLLDGQHAVGGQIYRVIGHADTRHKDILGPDYAAGAAIADALTRSGARHGANASVWQVTLPAKACGIVWWAQGFDSPAHRGCDLEISDLAPC